MNKIIASLSGKIISSNSEQSHFLQNKSYFGEYAGEKIQYSLAEALYLVDKGKMDVLYKGKRIPLRDLMEKLKRLDKKIDIKYPVFRDLREKGYIVKTALKFGAEFRVYDKGTTPKSSHAKWIVFTDSESHRLDWHEFAAKNRVAHSTKKKLLLAILDDENNIVYYEINWIRT